MSGSGQSRHFGRRPITSGLPPATDIVRAGRQVCFVPTSDILAGKLFEWCKLVHIPQSATAVSFDPISRRFRSHLKLRAALNLAVRELQIAVRPKRLFLNNRLACCEPAARTILKELSDCIGTRNNMRK